MSKRSRLHRLNGTAPHALPPVEVPLVTTPEERAQSHEAERLAAECALIIGEHLKPNGSFMATRVSIVLAGALIRRAELVGITEPTVQACLGIGVQMANRAAGVGPGKHGAAQRSNGDI